MSSSSRTTRTRCGSPVTDIADQLRKLAEPRDQGILTDDEFAAQKAKLLGL
ncbi:MAG: SHOCT domain-containing protein [Acidimicrobiales bacterium]